MTGIIVDGGGIDPMPVGKNRIKSVTFETDTSISVEKVIPETTEIVIYDYDFLLKQRDQIQKDLDDYTIARQVELDEVNYLIQQADAAGVKSKPIDTDPIILPE